MSYDDLTPEGRKIFRYLKGVLIKKAQVDHLNKCRNWILSCKTQWSWYNNNNNKRGWKKHGEAGECFALLEVGLQHKPAVGQLMLHRLRHAPLIFWICSACRQESERACLGAGRESCLLQSKGMNPVGHFYLKILETSLHEQEICSLFGKERADS